MIENVSISTQSTNKEPGWPSILESSLAFGLIVQQGDRFKEAGMLGTLRRLSLSEMTVSTIGAVAIMCDGGCDLLNQWCHGYLWTTKACSLLPEPWDHCPNAGMNTPCWHHPAPPLNAFLTWTLVDSTSNTTNSPSH